MQNKTSCRISTVMTKFDLIMVMYVFLCFSLEVIVFSASRYDTAMSLSPKKINQLYNDLEAEFNDPNTNLSAKGVLQLRDDNKVFWVIWRSDTLCPGKGIIGLYDHELKRCKLTLTYTILSVTIKESKGLGKVLLVRELSATGTGLKAISLKLLNPLNLKTIWKSIVEEDVLGPVKKHSSGYQLRSLISFVDLNCDNLDEMLIVRSKFYIPDKPYNFAGDPILSYEVLSYDFSLEKFIPYNKRTIDVIFNPDNLSASK